MALLQRFFRRLPGRSGSTQTGALAFYADAQSAGWVTTPGQVGIQSRPADRPAAAGDPEGLLDRVYRFQEC